MFIREIADTNRISSSIIPRINRFGNFYILAFPRIPLHTSSTVSSITIRDVIPSDFAIGENLQFIATRIFYNAGNETERRSAIIHLNGKDATVTFSSNVSGNYTILGFSLIWVDTNDSDDSQYEWYGLESENIPNIVAVDGDGEFATMVDGTFTYKNESYQGIVGYVSNPNSVIWWNATHIFPENQLHDGFFPNGKGLRVKGQSLLKLSDGQTRWAPAGSDFGSKGNLWYIIHESTLMVGRTNDFQTASIQTSIYPITTNKHVVADMNSEGLIAISSYNALGEAGVNIYNVSINSATIYEYVFIPIPSFNNIKFVTDSLLCIDGLFFEQADRIFTLIYDARLWVHPDLNSENYAITRNKLWNIQTLNQSIGTTLVRKQMVSNPVYLENFDQIYDYPYFDSSHKHFIAESPINYNDYGQIRGSAFWWLNPTNGKLYRINEDATAMVEATEFTENQVSTISGSYYTNTCGRFVSPDSGNSWYLNFDDQNTFYPNTSNGNYPYWGRIIEFTEGFYDVMTGVQTNIINSNDINVLEITNDHITVVINETESKIYGNHKFAVCTGETIYTAKGLYVLVPNSQSKKWRLIIQNFPTRKSAVATANGFVYHLWAQSHYYNIEEGQVVKFSPEDFPSSQSISPGASANYRRVPLIQDNVAFLSGHANGVKISEGICYDLDNLRQSLKYYDLRLDIQVTDISENDLFYWLSATQQVNIGSWQIYHYNVIDTTRVPLVNQIFDFVNYANVNNFPATFHNWHFQGLTWWNTTTQEVFYNSVKVTNIPIEFLTTSRPLDYVKTTTNQWLANRYLSSNISVDADVLASASIFVKDQLLNGTHALPDVTGLKSLVTLDNSLILFQWNNILLFSTFPIINGKVTVSFHPLRYNSDIIAMKPTNINGIYNCLHDDYTMSQINMSNMSFVNNGYI